ncbi:hypothetical protein G6F56_010845 [Rhizopus delemar]|nr:hypothetical protein G6F56_010845 [Rhizopus delemar]
MSQPHNSDNINNCPPEVVEAIKAGFEGLKGEIHVLKRDILQALEKQQSEREYMLKQQMMSEYRIQQQLAAFFQQGASYFSQAQQNAVYSYGVPSHFTTYNSTPGRENITPTTSAPLHAQTSSVVSPEPSVVRSPVAATQKLAEASTPTAVAATIPSTATASTAAAVSLSPGQSPKAAFSSCPSSMSAFSPGQPPMSALSTGQPSLTSQLPGQPSMGDFSPSHSPLGSHSPVEASTPLANTAGKPPVTNNSPSLGSSPTSMPINSSSPGVPVNKSLGYPMNPMVGHPIGYPMGYPQPMVFQPPMPHFTPPKPTMPSYQLNRAVKTVADAWKEYSVGIDGGPPVQDLERTYGVDWRRDRKESRFFSRRNILYNEVKRIAHTHNMSYEDAANDLEKQRTMMKKSLDGLGKFIKTRGDGEFGIAMERDVERQKLLLKIQR